MAKRIIKWTRTADIQLVGILEYWANRNKSPEYSKKLLKTVEKRTNQIAKQPLSYKMIYSNDTRVSTMGNYSVFYKITDNEILITAFWDNRQNPIKLLEVLKNKNQG